MGWNYTALDIATRNNHTESFNFLKMLVQNKNKHGSSKIRVAYIKIKLDSINYKIYVILFLVTCVTVPRYLGIFFTCFYNLFFPHSFLFPLPLYIYTYISPTMYSWLE